MCLYMCLYKLLLTLRLTFSVFAASVNDRCVSDSVSSASVSSNSQFHINTSLAHHDCSSSLRYSALCPSYKLLSICLLHLLYFGPLQLPFLNSLVFCFYLHMMPHCVNQILSISCLMEALLLLLIVSY